MEAIHSGSTNKATIMTQMSIGALIAGVLFLIIESYAEVYFIHHYGDMRNWFISDDTHTLIHRLLIVILFLSFGVINGFAIIKRRQLEVQLQELAEFDSLTRLYNRNMFITFLEKEIHRSKRYKEGAGKKDPALVMFDIDHFKKVNDDYGHGIGDHVLKNLSVLVKENIRNADILSRFGGEEFMIIAPETNMEGARILAEKVRHIVEEHYFNVVDRVTVSIGVSAYKTVDTIDDFIKRAEMALYKAKRRGRNRVEISL